MRFSEQEAFEICDALNSHAQHFDNLAATQPAPKQTKDVWRAKAERLRRLGLKVLNGRTLAQLETLIT